MRNKIFIAVSIVGLIAIRFVAGKWFYDPLISFFHDPEYLQHSLPEINVFSFSFFLFLRFLLNTFFGVLLVYFAFKQKALVQLTLIISGGLFAILFPQVIGLSVWASPDEYAWLFYTRRMLIHPVLILILLPAYLYYVYDSKQPQND